jgi:hypothetical protein
MSEVAIFYCEECETQWEVCGSEELGGWTPDNEESTCCPTCGDEGKSNDVIGGKS